MQYVKVEWLHQFPDDPVELYSEIDEEGWEVRRVELFRDGRAGFADRVTEVGSTALGTVPFPPIEEIAEDPQFRPVEITRTEFEEVWARYGPRNRG